MKRITLTVILLLAACLSLAAQSGTNFRTMTIANGTALSAAVDFKSCTPLRLYVSAAHTAANYTFQTSADGTNYGDLRDMFGGEVTAVVVAAGDVIALDPATFAGIRYLKLRSGTSGTPVNQGAARTITVACKTY